MLDNNLIIMLDLNDLSVAGSKIMNAYLWQKDFANFYHDWGDRFPAWTSARNAS